MQLTRIKALDFRVIRDRSLFIAWGGGGGGVGGFWAKHDEI